tara:strand:+ start:934 stop:1278 length:345 start_codon:yes stop_codon:yes gene_type:complete
MCFGDNQDEACGWPPKTVRAVIAITAVIISFSILSFMTIWLAVAEKYTESMALIGILSTELGTIVGYYFGTRNKQEQQLEIKELEKQITKAICNNNDKLSEEVDNWKDAQDIVL